MDGQDKQDAWDRWDVTKHDLSQSELEAGYRAMAADKEREAEALEWIEAFMGDALDDPDQIEGEEWVIDDEGIAWLKVD